MFLLQEALHAIYTECGMYKPLGPDRIPTLNDILNWLLKHPVKGRQALWMDSTLRGIQSLCFGRMGEVLNATDKHTDLAALLEQQVILELDALTSADKTFLVEDLLLWIHHYRLGQGRREEFKHALIIEEAHHILLKRSAGRGGEAVTDTILREIRELGEAVVLVDQHPSLISVPALGNTYTTIAMNLKRRSDVNAVGAAMLLEEKGKHLLGQLPVGWAMVKLQGRWTEPFVVRVPHLKLPKGAMTDQRLTQLSRGWAINAAGTSDPSEEGKPLRGNGASPPDQPPSSSRREEALLLDVAQHPLSGVVERYRRLGLNRRKGNAAKESCVQTRLLRQVPIPTRSGRTMLLELTDRGLVLLRRRGHLSDKGPLPRHRGGLEHEYWRREVARLYERQGYRVHVEEPINGYVDLVAQKQDEAIAVEIETGKSNWRDNITRDLAGDFSEVVVVCTHERVHLAISRETRSRWGYQEGMLSIVQAQEFCA